MSRQTNQIKRIHQQSILQFQTYLDKYITSISQNNIHNLQSQLAHLIVTKIQSFINKLSSLLNLFQAQTNQISNSNISKFTPINPSPHKAINQSLVTPTKPSNLSKYITYGFTSQIKTNQDFQSLASANDQLYKQFQDIIQKYRHNKQILNHQNQILLNQWLQNTNHISTIQIGNIPKKSNFFNLSKTLIQELSKYESVEEYINTIESIQHNKIVNELRSASLQVSDDDQKKWLKQTTKDYLLRMAQLLKNQDNNTNDDQDLEQLAISQQ